MTKNKPQIHQLPKKTIESIKENNQLDSELYQFSKQRLIKQLNDLGLYHRRNKLV